jgi:farnesyl diphosphate synthase
MTTKTAHAADDDKRSFLKCFDRLKRELIEDERRDNQVKIAIDWIEEMISYNVPHGKLNRGIAVMDGVRALNAYCSEELMWKAMVCGWGIEWLQAYFLVADDIMDESITRRGQPCWYRQPHVKMNAINDGILLEMQIYKILKRHVGTGDPAYAHLLELFHEVTYQTASGQLIDLITAPIGVVDLTKYTEEAYMRIVTYKTAFYTFYLPAAAAMRLSGVEDENAYKVANDICVKLGQFFQIQDDYLDCYGDPAVIGKIGTDIKDNKCGWLVVQALKKCSAEQREIIEENYGKDDAECEKKIKALYRELDLEKLYLEYEEKSYKELTEIMENQTALPKELFSSMLAKIYKRTK